MHQPELIKQIAEQTGVSQKVVGEILKAFSTTVTEKVKSGEEVKLQGFLTFRPKETKARTGRNPKTGEAINIEAKRSVTVSVGKSLKEALNS